MVSKKDKLLESAQRFVLKGQIDRAIREYQQLVALDPGENRYRQRLAELLVRDGRTEEAIEQYEDIGKHYADNSYLLKAIAVYTQILRLDPANTRILLTLASLNHKQGLTGGALSQYGQVVAALEKEGDLRQAIEVLEQMISLDGANLSIRFKHAELLRTLGERDRSYQAFNDILSALRARGDDANAAAFAQKMRLAFPEKEEIRLDKVRLLAAQGDLAGAGAALEVLLTREADNLELWQLLADLERRRKYWPGVRRASSEMARLYPDDAAVLGQALVLRFEAGGAAEGLDFLDLHLSRFLEAGDRSAARTLLESVPQAFSGHQRVQEGMRRLSGASGKAAQGAASPSLPTSLPAGELHLELEMEEFEGPPAVPAPSIPAPPVAPKPPAPAAAAEAEAEAGWEVEIELDLDDDTPTEQADEPLHFTAAGEGAPLASAAPSLGDGVTDEALPLEAALKWLEEEEGPVALESAETLDGSMVAPEGDALFAVLEPEEGLPEAAEDLASRSMPRPLPWDEIFPEYQAQPGAMDLEELESHYDLGIAYKEMGLYREAIKSLRAAAANPRRRLDALTLQALCFRELGDMAQSEELLRKGCAVAGLTSEERVSLTYELAQVCEQTGKSDEAQQLYREVYRLNPEFQDVAGKLGQLPTEEPLEMIELEEDEN